MKKLFLIRHAKSSWKYNVIDHERPLNEKGLNDANNISLYLKADSLNMDAVYCSDAVRTITTANIFFENLKMDSSKLQLNHDLYDFSGSNLIRVIKECDNRINHLMVFGHNHAITAFVNTFGSIPIDNVPTCGVVCIEFNIDNWKDLNKGKTLSTLFPKDLRK
ncbi:histidine phosphatase family protein [Mariniflexile litorale]|uniref:Histidine phosphatase family protein n=1 Tax=Mariniflexile litorale TaxID=3045158 RepID=A0AAU7ECA8_9FLAO|nr:histidine phosphatase family protein [Mariniflexile sp. KMM 9835]MDQ8212384.1 histidine phosphatase family protein [Mariniflexile sp. KMM 9835]